MVAGFDYRLIATLIPKASSLPSLPFTVLTDESTPSSSYKKPPHYRHVEALHAMELGLYMTHVADVIDEMETAQYEESCRMRHQVASDIDKILASSDTAASSKLPDCLPESYELASLMITLQELEHNFKKQVRKGKRVAP